MVKKSIKMYLCVIILIISILSLIPLKTEAATSSAGGYTIQSYDIDMVVNDDNTFDITEKIKVNFSSSRHGISRKLPLKNSIIRNDGTKSNNRATVTDIKVSEEFSTYKENGYEVIKIGSASSTVVGEHIYTIKYKYGIGKDPLENADELYFNLIGNEWDASIKKLSFKITMPKEFDKSLLGVTSGSKGSTNTSNVYYNVNGNVISGYTVRTLNSGDGVTVRLTLPEGYFANAKSTTNSIAYLMIIVPIICLMITLILWYKYGKDDEVIETVEFYPPEEYNSAEIGFLYKGKVEDNDIVSLLIYLANKGYLEISETDEKTIFSTKKGFKITKIKEYDGDNETERIFFKGLFKNSSIGSVNISKAKEIMEEAKKYGETISFKDALEMSVDNVCNNDKKTSVTALDLYDSFYITMKKVKSLINSKKNRDRIFESSTKGKSILVMTMIIISFLLIVFIPKITYAGSIESISTLFFILFFIPFITVFFGKNVPEFFKILWGLVVIPIMCSFLAATGLFEAIFSETVFTIGAVIGVICIITMFILYNLMPKRTPYGNEILGKIRGFKRFLETAEKEKLEAMVMENPTYFYDILPYTYVLGISDKWINQFETIVLQAPDWYSSTNSFNVTTFGSFMNSTMSSAKTAMISSPSESSGGSLSGGSSSGGSSGGGSSGGGSGGGGGGSW